MLGILAILLLAVGILAFPLLYDPDSFKQFLLDQVERQIGRKIEVRAAHLEVFPRIRLELTDVVIRETDPSHVFFQADRLELVLRAYSLLRQQVVGKRLAVERPRIQLRRDAEGRWNFLHPANAVTGDEEVLMGNPLALLMIVKESTVTEGQVTIIDEMRPDGVRSLEIQHLEAKIAVPPKGKEADVQVSGTLGGAPVASTFSMDGRIAEREPLPKTTSDDNSAPVPAITFEGRRGCVSIFGNSPTSSGHARCRSAFTARWMSVVRSASCPASWDTIWCCRK